MKKTWLLVIAFLLFTGASMAQQFSVEKSAEFDEPEYGWNKLLQLRNGNTFYFHSTKKDGIELTVYNKQRKQTAQKTLVSRKWDVEQMRSSSIKGLYEINGEPVLFVVQTNDNDQPTLYRMRLNGNNGAIVKEDELGKLPKTSVWAGLGNAYGKWDLSNIFIEKDPSSGNYAAVFFNTQAHNRSERIRVVHYDSTHTILNNAFYDSPNGSFKYLSYIGCVVDGNKRVFIATYGHSGATEDVSSKVIVSVLNNGDTTFKHKLLEFSEDFKDTKSVMLYNRGSNRIQLLTITYVKTKGGFLGKSKSLYETALTYINPETLETISTKAVAGEKIAAYAEKNIDKDYEYHGLPQNMIINKDNTTTLLMEDHTTVTETHTSGHMMVTTSYVLLGAVGVSELSDTGAELTGYAINKKQKASGAFPLLYLARRNKGIFSYPPSKGFTRGNTDEFLSYDYINAPNGHYVLFNDLPGNFDRDEDETKRKTTTSISATNTICFKLGGDKIDKYYLFGEPDGKRSATFSYIESSDYDKENNTYATLIVEKDGRDKSARVAWVKFQ